VQLYSIVALKIDRVLASDGRVFRFVFRNTGETEVRYAHARSGDGDRQQPIEATNATHRAGAAENSQIDKSAATQRI